MNASYLLWLVLLLNLENVRVFGQQTTQERVGFIPRTEQNSKRVQERMTAVQRLKYQVQKMNQMKQNGMNANGAKFNMMNSNGLISNGMKTNGMPSLGMGLRSMMGSTMGTSHGMSQINQMSSNGQMGVGYMNPDLLDTMRDMGMMPGMSGSHGMTMINVDLMKNGGMGMIQGSMSGNNRGGGRNNKGGRRKIMLPLCQPMTECAERFIPPQCRSWRFDTVNSIMCRRCPINRCEGGAAEYFNQMYEFHPSRMMYNLMQ